VKFLVDANLPRALTSWLADGGNEAFYVDDLLAAPAADDDIWKLAAANAFVVVSKDSDFAVRAARDADVRVVWIRCGNLKLSVFKEWFAARSEAMHRLLGMGEQVIELR
jgi:predicted nuclease of predicted toxin-antitoxin system